MTRRKSSGDVVIPSCTGGEEEQEEAQEGEEGLHHEEGEEEQMEKGYFDRTKEEREDFLEKEVIEEEETSSDCTPQDEPHIESSCDPLHSHPANRRTSVTSSSPLYPPSSFHSPLPTSSIPSSSTSPVPSYFYPSPSHPFLPSDAVVSRSNNVPSSYQHHFHSAVAPGNPSSSSPPSHLSRYFFSPHTQSVHVYPSHELAPHGSLPCSCCCSSSSSSCCGHSLHSSFRQPHPSSSSSYGLSPPVSIEPKNTTQGEMACRERRSSPAMRCEEERDEEKRDSGIDCSSSSSTCERDVSQDSQGERHSQNLSNEQDTHHSKNNCHEVFSYPPYHHPYLPSCSHPSSFCPSSLPPAPLFPSSYFFACPYEENPSQSFQTSLHGVSSSPPAFPPSFFPPCASPLPCSTQQALHLHEGGQVIAQDFDEKEEEETERDEGREIEEKRKEAIMVAAKSSLATTTRTRMTILSRPQTSSSIGYCSGIPSSSSSSSFAYSSSSSLAARAEAKKKEEQLMLWERLQEVRRQRREVSMQLAQLGQEGEERTRQGKGRPYQEKGEDEERRGMSSRSNSRRSFLVRRAFSASSSHRPHSAPIATYRQGEREEEQEEERIEQGEPNGRPTSSSSSFSRLSYVSPISFERQRAQQKTRVSPPPPSPASRSCRSFHHGSRSIPGEQRTCFFKKPFTNERYDKLLKSNSVPFLTPEEMKDEGSTKKKKKKPWNDSLSDLSRYRATPSDLITRRLRSTSPHAGLASEEYRMKLSLMQRNLRPFIDEYKRRFHGDGETHHKTEEERNEERKEKLRLYRLQRASSSFSSIYFHSSYKPQQQPQPSSSSPSRKRHQISSLRCSSSSSCSLPRYSLTPRASRPSSSQSASGNRHFLSQASSHSNKEKKFISSSSSLVKYQHAQAERTSPEKKKKKKEEETERRGRRGSFKGQTRSHRGSSTSSSSCHHSCSSCSPSPSSPMRKAKRREISSSSSSSSVSPTTCRRCRRKSKNKERRRDRERQREEEEDSSDRKDEDETRRRRRGKRESPCKKCHLYEGQRDICSCDDRKSLQESSSPPPSGASSHTSIKPSKERKKKSSSCLSSSCQRKKNEVSTSSDFLSKVANIEVEIRRTPRGGTVISSVRTPHVKPEDPSSSSPSSEKCGGALLVEEGEREEEESFETSRREERKKKSVSRRKARQPSENNKIKDGTETGRREEEEEEEEEERKGGGLLIPPIKVRKDTNETGLNVEEELKLLDEIADQLDKLDITFSFSPDKLPFIYPHHEKSSLAPPHLHLDTPQPSKYRRSSSHHREIDGADDEHSSIPSSFSSSSSAQQRQHFKDERERKEEEERDSASSSSLLPRKTVSSSSSLSSSSQPTVYDRGGVRTPRAQKEKGEGGEEKRIPCFGTENRGEEDHRLHETSDKNGLSTSLYSNEDEELLKPSLPPSASPLPSPSSSSSSSCFSPVLSYGVAGYSSSSSSSSFSSSSSSSSSHLSHPLHPPSFFFPSPESSREKEEQEEEMKKRQEDRYQEKPYERRRVEGGKDEKELEIMRRQLEEMKLYLARHHLSLPSPYQISSSSSSPSLHPPVSMRCHRTYPISSLLLREPSKHMESEGERNAPSFSKSTQGEEQDQPKEREEKEEGERKFNKERLSSETSLLNPQCASLTPSNRSHVLSSSSSPSPHPFPLLLHRRENEKSMMTAKEIERHHHHHHRPSSSSDLTALIREQSAALLGGCEEVVETILRQKKRIEEKHAAHRNRLHRRPSSFLSLTCESNEGAGGGGGGEEEQEEKKKKDIEVFSPSSSFSSSFGLPEEREGASHPLHYPISQKKEDDKVSRMKRNLVAAMIPSSRQNHGECPVGEELEKKRSPSVKDRKESLDSKQTNFSRGKEKSRRGEMGIAGGGENKKENQMMINMKKNRFMTIDVEIEKRGRRGGEDEDEEKKKKIVSSKKNAGVSGFSTSEKERRRTAGVPLIELTMKQ
ncbi:hypothetical protein CSUI_003982 [Cystoisospora suis]|uniref:Uncharacterized protein n=1 Tax=Cystoisospora suis TaxID=483139 RepID=A0A2C6L2R6_9APIC|nr:hypothetical protein CSUI_003982 [Cystoisospora suis]